MAATMQKQIAAAISKTIIVATTQKQLLRRRFKNYY
jgi:hypothetical protein